jgi:phage gp36-like protein
MRDVKTIGDLVYDDQTQATQSQLLTDPTLNFALMRASGELESAAAVANRYQPADLQALLAQNGVSAFYLKGIVADLAAFYLTNRRWRFNQDITKPYEMAVAVLEKLRNGDAIFTFVEVENAGDAFSAAYTQTEFANLHMMSSKRRIFGDTRVQDFIGYGPFAFN